jgi:hypothetical protein
LKFADIMFLAKPSLIEDAISCGLEFIL